MLLNEEYKKSLNSKNKDNYYKYADMLYKDYEKKENKERKRNKVLSFIPLGSVIVFILLNAIGYYLFYGKASINIRKANEQLENQAVIVEQDGVKIKSYYQVSVTDINQKYTLVTVATNTSEKTVKSIKVKDDISGINTTLLNIYPDETSKELCDTNYKDTKELNIKIESLEFE